MKRALGTSIIAALSVLLGAVTGWAQGLWNPEMDQAQQKLLALNP